jgi:hypothetical protein
MLLFMKKAVFILAVTLGCLISRDARGAAESVTLTLEQRITLRVDELAVLHIPSDSRYSRSAPAGDWRNVLALVKQSGRDVTFRAVSPGRGTIIISPNTKEGECISCATLHYFLKVVSQ